MIDGEHRPREFGVLEFLVVLFVVAIIFGFDRILKKCLQFLYETVK